MVAAKLVDELIEPLLLAEFGHNMYADGSAVALANLLHLTGPLLGDATAYDDMLHMFVAVARRRASAEVDDLFTAIDTFLASCRPDSVEPFAVSCRARIQ